jgi:hypothetical protein
MGVEHGASDASAETAVDGRSAGQSGDWPDLARSSRRYKAGVLDPNLDPAAKFKLHRRFRPSVELVRK